MASGSPVAESSEEGLLKCVICKEDLVDAVLLRCLHNACMSCTSSNETATISCPLCHVKTETSAGRPNLLVSSLAHRSLVLSNVFSCSHCTEEDQQYATAVVWCYTCQKPLCVDMQKVHNILHKSHKVITLSERTDLLELYRPLTRTCTEHDEEVKLACFTCEKVYCYKCAHDCYISHHEVQPIDGADAVKRIKNRVTQATALLSDLNSAVALLKEVLSLSKKVDGAREESLSILKNAKKAAIKSISSAYDGSEESLLGCWDTLSAKCLGLQESAQSLKAKVDWSNEYCQLAVKSNDVAGLLPQLNAVMSYLGELLEEARQFKEPVSPLTLITSNVFVPKDLDSIARGWFGTAKIVSDDFQSSGIDFSADEGEDYFTRKVATLNELEKLLDVHKQQQQFRDIERQTLEKLQSDAIVKDQQLAASQNEVRKLKDEKQDQQKQLEDSRVKINQLQSELQSKTQLLVSTQSEMKKHLDQQKELRELLERERSAVVALKSDVDSKTSQLVSTQSEVKKYFDQQKELREQLERKRSALEVLKSDVASKTSQLVSIQCEVKKYLDQQKELREQIERERSALEVLKSDVASKTSQLGRSFSRLA